VLSNQAGVGRGVITNDGVRAIHQHIRGEAQQHGGDIDAFYYCPHDWEEGCECRKPKPGLFFQAQRELNLDLTRTAFVGDDERDGEAAAAAGCRFISIRGNVSLLDAIRELLGRTRDIERSVNG
jgi:D-glycero-D-manno-heptose 1,7-bisphosphate phosphatase